MLTYLLVCVTSLFLVLYRVEEGWVEFNASLELRLVPIPQEVGLWGKPITKHLCGFDISSAAESVSCLPHFPDDVALRRCQVR